MSIYHAATTVCNPQMAKTIADIYLENLETLISEVGTAARLAELAETSPSYLSQVRNQRPTPGGDTPRSFSSDMCRRLEQAAGKPVGWMDQDHSSELSAGALEFARLYEKCPEQGRAALLRTVKNLVSIEIRDREGENRGNIDYVSPRGDIDVEEQ